MSTQFKELYTYPGPAYDPLGGHLLGEPDDRDRHVEMWADALFEQLEVPCAKGGWESDDDLSYRQGLRTCKECGAAVMVWGRDDEESLNRHRAWHDKLYEAVCRVQGTNHERQDD